MLDPHMKTILSTLILLAVFCGCASAEPPDHNDVATTNMLTIVAPAGAPVDGIICYGANHADSNWTVVKVFSCTNGQYMASRVPRYELYTAVSTNSQLLRYSDYMPKVEPNTNGFAIMPVPVGTVTPK